MKFGSSYINTLNALKCPLQCSLYTGVRRLGRGQLEVDSFDDLRGVLALPLSNVVYGDVHLDVAVK